ncbi:MAG: class I SAM-dependent methyltransferase, partial [Microcystaceae cyanobacterium]
MSTAPHSQSLRNIIIDHISASPQQRITFADYMDLVLYHPEYGYYTSGTVKIGAKGDFFTASSLGPDFGELLAEQFVEMWEILGYPEPFALVEMGAGSGLLAADILQYLQHKHLNLFNVLEYIIVEQSESLIKEQKLILEKWLHQKINLSWKRWQEIPETSIVGCAFSNELVDAFPVHQFVLKKREMKEVYVTFYENQFQETFAEISTNQLLE